LIIILLWIEKEANGISRRVGGERALASGVERYIIRDENNNRELIKPC
jgi:hypothetical protein